MNGDLIIVGASPMTTQAVGPGKARCYCCWDKYTLDLHRDYNSGSKMCLLHAVSHPQHSGCTECQESCATSSAACPTDPNAGVVV